MTNHHWKGAGKYPLFYLKLLQDKGDSNDLFQLSNY